MKRLLSFILVPLLLVGCASSPNTDDALVGNYDISQTAQSEMLTTFYEVAEKEKPYQVFTFIKDHLSNSSTLEVDMMMLTYMSVQNAYLDSYRETSLLPEYQDSLKILYEQRKFEASTFKEGSFIYELQQGGYRIIESANTYIPIPDYSKLKFDGITSSAFNDYIDLASVELTIPYIVDRKINISWDELAKRTYACEEYLIKHPKSMNEKNVKVMYRDYMKGLTRKVGESFVYDSQTPKLLYEVRQTYLNYIYFYPDYSTTEILDKYLKLYETTGRVTNELLQQVETLIDESKLLLNLNERNQGN